MDYPKPTTMMKKKKKKKKMDYSMDYPKKNKKGYSHKDKKGY